jgi:hypothetical protein
VRRLRTAWMRATARRVAIRGVLLLAKDRQAFLQRQLEPVAAGHAVAGPVVEILVGDGPVDEAEVPIGGDVGAGQHQLGVEDVQAFVLHRAGVEVAHGHHVVFVQVDFQAVAVFVPLHRVFERLRGERDLVQLAGLDEELQLRIAPGARAKAVFAALEIGRHHREQVGGLGERVLPARPVPAASFLALRYQVPVGQQHRVSRLVAMQGNRVTRHHVGPIQKRCDAAKALRFAEAEEAGAGKINPHQLGVLPGMDAGDGLQLEGFRHGRHGQVARVGAPATFCQRRAVDGN